jgi:hypothetical protein
MASRILNKFAFHQLFLCITCLVVVIKALPYNQDHSENSRVAESANLKGPSGALLNGLRDTIPPLNQRGQFDTASSSSSKNKYS